MKDSHSKVIVSSNLATSLDGKIATASREFFSLGTKTDHALMQKLRIENDLILSGASTLRAYKKPWHSKLGTPKKQPLNAILTRSLEDISPTWEFFTKAITPPLIFHTKPLDAKTLQKFKKVATLVALDPNSKKLGLSAQIIQHCKNLGYHRLLVEGGGSVMWEFVKLNLIDFYYVTLTPTILGGKDAPSLVEGTGLSADSRLKLKLEQAQVIGDELYLVYRRSGRISSA